MNDQEVRYMNADPVPFTQVPDTIWEDDRTSQAERLLYCALWYHVNVKRGDRIVWPGQRRLAELCRMGRDTVVAGLSSLVEHGYLRVLSPGNNRNSTRYHLTGGPVQDHHKISGPVQDRSGPQQDRTRSSAGPEQEDERTKRTTGGAAAGSPNGSRPAARDMGGEGLPRSPDLLTPEQIAERNKAATELADKFSLGRPR